MVVGIVADARIGGTMSTTISLIVRHRGESLPLPQQESASNAAPPIPLRRSFADSVETQWVHRGAPSAARTCRQARGSAISVGSRQPAGARPEPILDKWAHLLARLIDIRRSMLEPRTLMSTCKPADDHGPHRAEALAALNCAHSPPCRRLSHGSAGPSTRG